MNNYFQGNSKHPQHISVGAVILNEKKEVCCHHFNTEKLKGYWVDGGLNNRLWIDKKMGDFYLLMRETLNPKETLEDALHRGTKEEFGITAKLVDYVGSLQSHFPHDGITVEKTTLYFLMKFIDQNLNQRNHGDIEGNTDVEWHSIDFLMPKMEEQAQRFKRTDVDESKILMKVKELLI